MPAIPAPRAGEDLPGGSLSRAVALPVILVHQPGDGLHYIEQPKPHGHTWLRSPEGHDQCFGGRGRLSLGPVLMYADIFIRRYTKLRGVDQAYKQAYPRAAPPFPLDRDWLVRHFIVHVMPIDPGGRRNSIALWNDLTAHGLNRLAEVIVLAAQDKAYRAATHQPPPWPAKDTARHLVQSLCLRHRSPARLPGASSRASAG